MAWNDIRKGNPLKERLCRGEVVLGCFQRIPAPEVTELCSHAGFDLVIVDMEHAPISEERVAGLVRAAEAAEVAAVVRVAGADPVVLARVLEVAPAGVQFPLVRSAAEAEAAVRATRHLPDGSRGLSLSRASGYGRRMSLAEYVSASEEALLVVVQVEDRVGLREVEAIAAVPGVDVVFIGLTDLSQDLGAPGRFDHPALREAVEHAFRQIRAQGKAAGVPVTEAAMAEEYVALGATYVTANDVRLLLDASVAFVAALRPA